LILETKPTLLIVDDEPDALDFLSEAFQESYEIEQASSGSLAVQKLQEREFDLVLTDLHMPGKDGMAVLQASQEKNPDAPVVMVTAYGSTEAAIRATKQGAYHFITKPFKIDEVELILSRALEKHRLRSENKTLKTAAQPLQENEFQGMIAKSPPMLRIFDLIRRVGPSESNVLVLGDSGTGKEMVAKALHTCSKTSKGPFTAINCAAIPENLLESELFGHKKGSFTGAVSDKKGLFEEANGGTIFLDEIGELPLSLQAKLLRAIQTHKVKPVGDVKDIDFSARIICATNRDLKREVSEKRFREDLYYRLSVLPIKVPSLSERKDDILILANYFLRKFSKTNGLDNTRFTKEAISKILMHNWPGNVRELENVIERAVVLSTNGEISRDDLLLDDEINSQQNSLDEFLETFPTLKEIEEYYIKKVLAHTNGKKEETAKILGINRRTLHRKELSYDLN